MPSCQEVARMLSERRDHAISPVRRLILHVHLIACEMCRQFGRQLELIGRWSRAAGDPDNESLFAPGGAIRATLSPAARSRIKARLARR